MIEVPNSDVFVAIAAYREPELRATIESCVAMADRPEGLHFGVCLQYDRSGPPETQPDCLDGVDADIRLLSHDWTESKGGCWARHRAQSLYGGEGYTMQIDSHMQMAPHWDRRLIDMMHEFPAEKPLITGHCPLYELADGAEVILGQGHVPVTVFKQIDEEGWIWHPGEEPTADQLVAPRPTRALSGMFVFTLGIWNEEVRQDPEHLYTGEELALTMRSFTHGYDLFNPTSVVAWHRMHPEGNRKYVYDADPPEVQRRNERAYRRLRILHAGDPDRILLPYSVGTVRSVREYHEWAGVDVESWTVTDDARTGVTPPLFRPSW